MIPGMPSVAAALAQRQPQQAFTWGQGGARIDPDQALFRQRMAQQNMAAGMDTSPVGHWAQGLARVAQALVGNVQQGRLDRDLRASDDARAAIVANLAGTPDSAALSAGLADRDPGIRSLAESVYERQNPKPVVPTEFERAVASAGYVPGTPEYTAVMRDFVTNRVNPIQAVPGVDEQGNQVLRFMRPSTMGGGDPASTGSGGATPPATLPPDFDFGAGGPTPKASAGFP